MKTLSFVALILALAATIAHSEVCTVPGVGVGACISTSTCSSRGGTSHPGYCSGGTDTQCCTGIICDGTGLCMQSSECTGTVVTGKCPGPNGFACCKNLPCDSGRGTCMPRASCTGTVKTGVCPGPSGYVCCTSTTPSGSGAKIVSAAESMVGKYPYSWGGGDNNGPTYGIKQTSDPYCDDRNVKGFDCSGLSKYAVYQGTGTSLYHGAQSQYNNAPKKIALNNKQPGDLLFYGSSTSNIYHVAIYAGNNMMIEASGHNADCSGKLVRKRTIYTDNLLSTVARYW